MIFGGYTKLWIARFLKPAWWLRGTIVKFKNKNLKKRKEKQPRKQKQKRIWKQNHNQKQKWKQKRKWK